MHLLVHERSVAARCFHIILDFFVTESSHVHKMALRFRISGVFNSLANMSLGELEVTQPVSSKTECVMHLGPFWLDF